MGVDTAVRMSAGELACTYAALILFDDGQEVSEDKLKALLNGAKVEYESYWPSLFSKALAGQDMGAILTKPVGGGGGGGCGGAAAPGAAAAEGGAAAVEEEEEEEEEEL